jgi:hypothetical protein
VWPVHIKHVQTRQAMYMKCDTLTHLRDHCCRRKTTAPSFSIFKPFVAVSNIQLFSVVMETQKLFAFGLLNYKIFLTAINNESIKVIESSCKAPAIFVRF